MPRFKSIRISAVNWCCNFKDAVGSYYDYVCSMASFSEKAHLAIKEELVRKGWTKRGTKNEDLSLFEKERHLIRISKVWVE